MNRARRDLTRPQRLLLPPGRSAAPVGTGSRTFWWRETYDVLPALPGSCLIVDGLPAAQLLTWWLGDRQTEWAALGEVDTKGRLTRLTRLHFNDDDDSDTPSSTVIRAPWRAKLVTRIEGEGRDSRTLALHVHSHGDMAAYHSPADHAMIMTWARDMGAPGRLWTLVLGRGMSFHALVSDWTSDGAVTRRELPVTFAWPDTLPSADVLAFCRERIALRGKAARAGKEKEKKGGTHVYSTNEDFTWTDWTGWETPWPE